MLHELSLECINKNLWVALLETVLCRTEAPIYLVLATSPVLPVSVSTFPNSRTLEPLYFATDSENWEGLVVGVVTRLLAIGYICISYSHALHLESGWCNNISHKLRHSLWLIAMQGHISHRLQYLLWLVCHRQKVQPLSICSSLCGSWARPDRFRGHWCWCSPQTETWVRWAARKPLRWRHPGRSCGG